MAVQEARIRQPVVTSVSVAPNKSAQDATRYPDPDARVPPDPDARVRLLHQAGIVAVAVAAYFLVRGATESAAAEALRNARRVVDVELALGLYHEPGLQEALAGSPMVRTVLNWVYIWGHWPVVVVTLVWLARRSPEVFRRTRNAMMVSGGIGLVLFALFPVAPPRLAGLGMADTVSLTSHSYRVLQPAAFTNQYAAMPSLHVGWNLLIGLAIVVTARRVVTRAFGVAMPVAMVLAVVLTANHYIVDALAGAALTMACWYLVLRRPPGRHRTRRPSLRRDPQRPGTSVVAGYSASMSRTCWPYLASLCSPMPLIRLTASRVDGHSAAIWRRVESWKITYAGTPWSLAASARQARSRSNTAKAAGDSSAAETAPAGGAAAPDDAGPDDAAAPAPLGVREADGGRAGSRRSITWRARLSTSPLDSVRASVP